MVYLVKGFATGWMVWDSNPGGGKIFQTHPDRPQGPPSFLYKRYQVSFHGLNQPDPENVTLCSSGFLIDVLK